MSREIKFRVWDAVAKRYVDLSTLTITYDGKLTAVTTSEIMNPVLNQKNYIVEQYTGLKDKNGKEIYEGDIVAIRNKNNRDEYDIGVVGWKKGAFHCPFLLGKYQSNAIEIVGNIHENEKDTVFPMNSKQNKGDEK